MQTNLKNLKIRSSHWGCSIKKVFLKISQIHRKTPVLKSLIKLKDSSRQLCQKENSTLLFFCEFSKNFKNISFNNTERLLLEKFILNSMLLDTSIHRCIRFFDTLNNYSLQVYNFQSSIQVKKYCARNFILSGLQNQSLVQRHFRTQDKSLTQVRQHNFFFQLFFLAILLSKCLQFTFVFS